jgi:signal transduction histidine kinase
MKFAEAGMEIVTNLDPNLCEIKADREKLVQALINIFLNALEASSYGARIRIDTAFASPQKNGIAIIIADEGCGIPNGHASEIFKPFFTSKSFGTGLGLSNARRIIEAHGGNIDVENGAACGAFVNIILPIESTR